MWDCYYQINIDDHILSFDGLRLENVQYEPDYGCFIDVEFGDDYFISGESNDKVDITTRYRGLKGTRNYQVDLLVDGQCVKTFMIQTSPIGDILTPKENQGW